MHGPGALPDHAEPDCVADGGTSAWVSSRLIDESSVSDSGASKPQHCAVSGPACRLRCRPTALAPPNRLLRKLLAEEGLPRAAHHQARNPPGLRPLGHARPPTRTRRHLGAASRRGSLRRRGRPGSNSGSSGSSGGRSDTRTPYGLLSLHYPNPQDRKPRRYSAAESATQRPDSDDGRRQRVTNFGWTRALQVGAVTGVEPAL
jgi:hypothetical protein